MATLFVNYDSDNLSYKLNFTSALNTFDTVFNVSVPKGFEYKPVKSFDGFVAAVIFAAMESGEDLEIMQPMTLKGLQNLTYFVEAWANLLPERYKKIKLNASEIANLPALAGNQAVLAFSGGVDACFSLIRNAEADWADTAFDVQYVLGVQGFDIGKEKFEEYDQLMARVAPIYEQYGCQRLKVWTDLKDNSRQDWNMSHAAQLASCLFLFSEHFPVAMIGSSEPYKDFYLPWGSTPATDYLLSGRMAVVHDGAGFTRTQKVERIAKNELATSLVKVCYQLGYNNNCGHCEKCYRTRLNFYVVGQTEPLCFDTPIDFKQLGRIKFNREGKLKQLKSIYDYVIQKDIKQAWVTYLKYIIIKNYILYHSPPKLWLRKLKYTLKRK